MPRALRITRDLAIPGRELALSFVRSSGPGGQNVNKVSTKAELRWPVATSGILPGDVRERFLVRFRGRINDAGEVVLRSQRFRDQKRNADDCMKRLHAMLLTVLEPPRTRRPTRASPRSVEERLKSKRRAGEKKRLRGERPQEQI